MLNNPSARRAAAVVIEPPAKALLRLGVSPDAVTVTGALLAVVVAIVCFPTGRLVLGVVLLALLSFSDLIDGTMARLSGSSGPWGNFLDATMDRLADGAIFGGLAVYGATQSDLWLVTGAIAALVTGQVTPYAKARAEAVGATANVGIAERAERLFIAAIAVILGVVVVPWAIAAGMWLLAALGVVTIIQRMVVVRRQLRP